MDLLINSWKPFLSVRLCLSSRKKGWLFMNSWKPFLSVRLCLSSWKKAWLLLIFAQVWLQLRTSNLHMHTTGCQKASPTKFLTICNSVLTNQKKPRTLKFQMWSIIGWNSCRSSKFPSHWLSGRLLWVCRHVRKSEVLGLNSEMGTSAITRVIEQCCFNSVPDPFNGQTVYFILRPPKVIESRT